MLRLAITAQGQRHAIVEGALETLCGRSAADMTLGDDYSDVTCQDCLRALARRRVLGG